MKEKVEQALTKIRPALQADGGDVELVDVDANGVVTGRAQGSAARGLAPPEVERKAVAHAHHPGHGHTGVAPDDLLGVG